ncbi:hypothetical protein EPR50_G00124220 [Perca flavescens]|uniref:CIDE-N domain-containing protein n=1 Tax=Perca flavescens TaxID=8167 RepID=A0A484CTP6_PERFV|nr:hypothetical protein EPR50_G00124220 [Perca flavescens]
MLIKVKCGGTKKYVKMEDVSFSDFISAVQQKFLIPESTPLKVTDEQGIEVDEDVFPELATAKEICFVIYSENEIPLLESFTNTTNCADLTEFVTLTPCDVPVLQQEREGPSSPSLTDTLSISSSLSSDTSDAGFQMIQPVMEFTRARNEHFYDMQSNKGFLEWRIKTAQRQSKTSSASRNRVELKGGPTSSRTSGSIDDQQTGDECMEAMSLLHHITDRDFVFQKMKETFHYRQKMLHDPQQSADILQMFPRFLDTKGLILQDFLMMFGSETASRFLEKWNTSFKDKVIQEARTVRETSLLKKQLKSALNEESDTADEPEWDSDMASLLVLLHLLTPQPAGRKRPKKISVGEATDHLVKFHKSCHSLEEHLMTIEGNPQPYLLATGTSKAQVFTFYIVLDRKLLPCQSSTSLGAFDELFKSHFVFSVQYDDALSSLYRFLQTTLYNIDIGTTEETPRVKELRAKLLNKH